MAGNTCKLRLQPGSLRHPDHLVQRGLPAQLHRQLRRPLLHRNQLTVLRATSEWGALAKEEEDVPDEEDEYFQAALNELCNKALKAMLSEDIQLVMRLKDEINEAGQLFTDAANMRGAVFIYVVLRMAEHTIVPQADALEGPYKAAFLKLYDLLQDSGWALVREGEEHDDRSSIFQEEA